MNMKKTALASTMALALVSGSAWAAECANPDSALGKGENVGFTTYTCKGEFILDKTEVRAGETVNLALMGLNSSDEVDRFGEQGGSVIMGVVNTVKGQINAVPHMGNSYAQGSKTPGAKPDASEPGYGSFASEVSYIRLGQGNGQVSIYYPPEASGEDILTLTLQERRATANGGVEFNVIAKATKVVKIAPPSDNPMGLDIVAFEAPLSDVAGMSDSNEKNGIKGEMTAGSPGAIVHVKARNDRAAGPITLTLIPKIGGSTLTYNGKMVRGYAKVNLDSNIKKAYTYYMKATFGSFAGSSIDMIYEDTLIVKPTGKPVKLGLSSVKSRVSEKLEGGGTEISGYLLDVYGNTTTYREGKDVRFIIKDGYSTAANSALDLYVPAGSTHTVARSNDGILGNTTGEIKEGNVSLVATAANADGTPNSSIAASDPLEIQVTKESLIGSRHAEFSSTKLAGNEFKAFIVDTTDGFKPGQVVIEQMGTTEELTVNLNADREAEALFKKATGYGEYLLSDRLGKYGQVIVDAFGIDTAATTLVKLTNAHGEVLDTVPPIFDDNSKTYITLLPEVAFKMTDAYGNHVTPGIESVTGSFYLESSNGGVAYNTPETDRAIPSRNAGYGPTVTYKATGEEAFVGEDVIGVTFTKPGLGTEQMQVKSAVAAINKLKEFSTLIEQSKIPINSEVALTVEAIGTDGDIFMDASTARVRFNMSEEDGLLETFRVYEVYGEANSISSWGGQEIFDGQTLDFGMSQGRKVFLVEAGPVEGKFTLTFEDANDTGATGATQELEVTRQLVEAVCSTTDPTACVTEAECTAVDGVWDPATTSCGTKDVTGCSAENPSACTDQASCVATGGAIYLEGYTNVTDGCYGVPTDPTETVSNIIYKEGTRTPVDSHFAGGVLVDGKFSKNEKVGANLGKVTIAFNYRPVAGHVGQAAHLLTVIGVESPDTGPIDGSFDTNYFGLSEFIGDYYPVNVYADNHPDDETLPEGQINQPGYWTDEIAKLAEKPYLGNVTLQSEEQVVLVPGDLGDLGGFKGALYFFVGYMLTDGDDKDAIVFNDRPIVLIVE